MAVDLEITNIHQADCRSDIRDFLSHHVTLKRKQDSLLF